jgi:hypothetical protein
LKLSAQTIQTEINNQVWKPFCRSLMSLDTAAYMSLHDKELIRVERGNKKIYGYDYYRTNTKVGFEQSLIQNKKSPGVTFEVELRFLERIATNTMAYEVGYYKSVITFTDGRISKYYSKFHVSLKKTNDKWKILIDASLPMPQLTEEEFLKASPI